MSLLVRQLAQPALNEAGLESFHIEIKNSYLSIVTRCGKPFVTISSISFGKKEPSLTQAQYAVELLRDYLEIHEELLKEVIIDFTNYEEAQQAFERTLQEATMTAEYQGNSLGTVKFNPSPDVQASVDNQGRFVTILLQKPINPSDLVKIINTPIHAELQKGLNLFEIRNNMRNQFNRNSLKLSTCSI